MHAARRIVAVSLLVGAILAGAAGSAHALCAAPSIAVSPSSSSPGYRVTVQGSGFFAECTDTIPPGETDISPLQPATSIQIVFEQGGARRELGVVDADASLAFSASVEIPGDAVPGTATITAGSAAPATIEIVAVSGTPSEAPARLPNTGGSSPLALLGIALVAAGLATTRVSRFIRS